MKRVRVRLPLMALVCVAAGLSTRLALVVLAPPQSRAQAWDQWSLQVLWYAGGLFLFLAYLWCLGTTGRPGEEVPGCGVAVLWVACALAAFVLLALLAVPGE
jgi:hypothetical protein